MTEAIDYVRDYYNRGWTVVAAPTQDKKPSGAWKQYQTERPTLDMLEAWFRRPANVFLLTGAASGGLIVLDCDNDEAVDFWREKIGEDALEQTAAVMTGKGCHYYFQLPEGAVVRNRSNSEGEPPWDIRGEGGGVIAPPSIHESGRVYKWERPPDAIVIAPAGLVEYASTNGNGDSDNVRSLLNELLQNPPSEGNRNNWLARVAGHYAKQIRHGDAYETMVRQQNERLDPPLPDEEVDKTIQSIWSAQQAKSHGDTEETEDYSERWRDDLRQPTEDNGWLVSGKTRILTQVRTKVEESYKYELMSWLNCDIRVLGLIESDDSRQWSVQLRFPDGRVTEDHVSSSTVTDRRALDAWLGRHGASIQPPDNIFPKTAPPTARMLRYLMSQNAEPMEAAEALGWHSESGSFITHDGVIRPIGPATFEHVRPGPQLRKWAPYAYGFSGLEAAREILAEVMTFHDDTVTAVFGAWWAAVFLKPQIHMRSSQFPFMAIEAPSESGKTKGFFPLMMQLAGNTAGHLQPTRASLRDYLSAHWNGIVWMDDLDSLDAYGEILRNVTVRGSMAKKGQDNTSQIVATMRSALVITGEALGLRNQKALVDRAVALDVGSPMGRRSLKDPERPQWDDIVDLTTTYPDLSVFAGDIVQLALQQQDVVSSFKSLRIGDGRHADAMAVLRLGARVLRGMLGDAGVGIVERVDAWVEGSIEAYTGKENALTLKLIPRALAQTGWKDAPDEPDEGRRLLATPAFVKGDTVWFSPKFLAEWWEKNSRQVTERTETEKVLADQARELGLGGKKGYDRVGIRFKHSDRKATYWRCGDELSALLVKRSKGQEDGDSDYDQGELQ